VYYDEVAVTSFTSLELAIMKTRKFVAAATMLGLFASCAQAGPREDNELSMNTINTLTSGEHDRIARRYENAARELFVKVEKHKKLLQHYEDKSYLYGRHGQEFQSHTEAVLRKYKLAGEKAASQAAFHSERAAERVLRDYAASAGHRIR
jgi:hypothetical protein